MNHFAYVCADPGIPLPGTKGASIHVASVCRELRRAGLHGVIHGARPEADSLEGLPVVPISPGVSRAGADEARREARLFLSSLNTRIASTGPCDFVYERYSLWHVGGLARARELDVPFVLEVNSPLPVEAKRFRGLVNDRLADGTARLLLREADAVVTVSDEVAEWVVEQRGSDREVWVVPNGVDPERFAPGARAQRAGLPPPSAPLIAFAGSFRPWHATDDLLEAFRIVVEDWVSDAHLLCVGDGPMREPFERRARELGLAGRVHVSGRLPHEEVAAWLRGADVAVAPYPHLAEFYFSPLKVFEYFALGLPVVAANAGQLPGLVPHRERGLLYTPGEPRELAEAIAHLLRNRVAAERLGAAGREWVLANATWSKRVETILRGIEAL